MFIQTSISFFAVRSNIRIGGSVLQTPQSGLYRRGRPNAVSERPDLSVYHSYAIVLELNELKMQQTIAAAQRVSRYSEKDVYINCFGSLEIKSAHGTLTDEDLSSELCVNLLALLVIDRKAPVSTDRVVDALWPNGVTGNKYRAVSNILYRLRRTLSIIGLEEFIVSKMVRSASIRIIVCTLILNALRTTAPSWRQSKIRRSSARCITQQSSSIGENSLKRYIISIG